MQFEIRREAGRIMVQHKIYSRIVVTAYTSPRATEKQNKWLGFWLKVVYNIYFLLVSMDNCLEFFNEREGNRDGNGKQRKD